LNYWLSTIVGFYTKLTSNLGNASVI